MEEDDDQRPSEVPADVTMRDLFGDDEDGVEEEPKRRKAARRRRSDDESDHNDDEDDDDGHDSRQRKSKKQRNDEPADTEPTEGTWFGMRRKLVESMLTFKIPPDLKKRLQNDRAEIDQNRRAFFGESHKVFLSDVIQGMCRVSDTGGCERCAISASYWICGENLEHKWHHSAPKGIIYEAFRVFYNDAEKLPDLTGINWHNFVISDLLRFSDIQFRPTFYLAADIVELLCADRSFVLHIRQPRLARRLADFLLFAIQFHATENALKQIANRLVPEIRQLGLSVPATITPLSEAIRSPARSIRKKRILRYLKQLVQFVLASTAPSAGTKSERCVLLTRLFLLGLRRPG